MPSHYSRDDDEAAESQALILERLKTGPQPLKRAPPEPRSSSPTTSTAHRDYRFDPAAAGNDADYDDNEGDSLNALDLEEQTDELLEKRRQRALAKQTAKAQEEDPVNSAGRPPWLLRAINWVTAQSLVRKLALAASALGVLALVFYLAVGPTGDGTGHHLPEWRWSGNFWKGGKMPYDFPSDVGYPGPTQKGPPSQLAQEDTVSQSGAVKKPWNALPLEITLPNAQSQYGTFEPL